ncbi:S1/P1 nuclease [Janthinobacterium psychrotolerans]|uniref:S1/P1 Nuclease n=1 Tax=Janthinobacterium psychrotolerans TaxID=1747903 RepID=A0A1A7C2W7_9BURK|nr:S1/P1 nuclease [Janthinobacterium psychrotolerans]OBV40077.1 S1/P1 Nuclease [Janthinobacterium psychrotolerans]
MKKLSCVLALAGAFMSGNALAWGTDGHRAVGAIADQLLKGSAAQANIAALLLPGETLESIANWPDCVKGSYCGPQSPEMQAYVAANPKHSAYHYTDIPFQNAHYHDGAVGSADDDIVQTLKQAILVLQGKADAASNPHQFTPRQALILLTHMVGDIHQPLHVGAAYLAKDGSFVVPESRAQIDGLAIFDARGGNNLLLDDAGITALSDAVIPAALPQEEGAPKPAAYPKSPTKPLHSYWDSTVVDYAMRRLSTRTPRQFAQTVIASKPDVPGNTGEPSSWPYQWADASLAASKIAYAGVVAGPATQQTSRKGEPYYVWSLKVPGDYPVPSSALAKTQLINGGYHLAAVLRAIWP